MSVDDVVSQVGLWWPVADEDVLSSAADAWDRAATALDRAGAAGLDGAARVGSTWSGASAEAFDRTRRDHAGVLRGDAVGRRALGGRKQPVGATGTPHLEDHGGPGATSSPPDRRRRLRR